MQVIFLLIHKKRCFYCSINVTWIALLADLNSFKLNCFAFRCPSKFGCKFVASYFLFAGWVNFWFCFNSERKSSEIRSSRKKNYDQNERDTFQLTGLCKALYFMMHISPLHALCSTILDEINVFSVFISWQNYSKWRINRPATLHNFANIPSDWITTLKK